MYLIQCKGMIHVGGKTVLLSGHRLGEHHSCLTTVTNHETIWFVITPMNGAGNLLCHRVGKGERERREWERRERGGRESRGLEHRY